MYTSLSACIAATIGAPDFLKEYDRLNNTSFARGGVAAAIDKVTGKRDEDAKALAHFIFSHIWLPLVAQGELEVNQIP